MFTAIPDAWQEILCAMPCATTLARTAYRAQQNESGLSARAQLHPSSAVAMALFELAGEFD